MKHREHNDISLQARLHVELPSTLVFDHPSVSAITSFVVSKAAPDAAPASKTAGAAAAVTTAQGARPSALKAPVLASMPASQSKIVLRAVSSRVPKGLEAVLGGLQGLGRLRTAASTLAGLADAVTRVPLSR